MASEIRVNKINSQTGVGTITLSPTGVDISGVTTVSTLKVGTGVTASEDGDIFFTGVCTATTFTGSGANLTNLPAANLSGTLPAISAANLTNVPAANITGTLPAISAANLTNIPAANVTGTLPALTAANLTNIPAANLVGVCTSGLTKTGGFGKILQVVSATKTDTASTASGTPANISGLTPTITTTETNSKILVMMDVKLSCGSYGDHVGLNLYRSITGGSAGEIYRGDADSSRGRYSWGAEDIFGGNGDHQLKQVSSTFVDSPSQAAGTEIVYSIQWNHLAGQAIYLNRDGDNSNDARSPRTASSLTLIEIAA